MNLSFLSYFRSLRSEPRRQFAVIGLGRFGKAVCSTLHNLGYEVLASDKKQERVDQVLAEQLASHCVQMDSTNPHALQETGVTEFETVIVAIGNYLEESIITTLNLKEAGVPHVVAKASTEVHGTLLKKVGADLVVFPEAEMGCALARNLTQQGILERLELDPDHSIVEIMVPEDFHGKTLLELNLRRRYGISVLAVSRGESFEINPDPTEKLQKGSAIVIIGDNRDICKLPTTCSLENLHSKSSK